MIYLYGVMTALLCIGAFVAGRVTVRSRSAIDHSCPTCGCVEFVEDALHEPPMGYLGTYYTFKCGFERDWHGQRRGFCGGLSQSLPF